MLLTETNIKFYYKDQEEEEDVLSADIIQSKTYLGFRGVQFAITI